MGSKALILRQTARVTEGSEQSWWFWLVRMGVIQEWVPSWSDCSGLTFGLRVAARKRYISSHRSIDSIGGKCPNMVTWCKQISFLFVFTRPSQFSPSDLVNSLKRYSSLPYGTHPVRVDFHLPYLLVSWDLLHFELVQTDISSVFSNSRINIFSDGILWNCLESHFLVIGALENRLADLRSLFFQVVPGRLWSMFSEVYMLVNVTTYEVLVCPPHMCNRFPRRGSSLWYLQGASWVPRTAENGRMVLILYEYTVGTWVDGYIPLFEKKKATPKQSIWCCWCKQHTKCFGMIANEGSIIRYQSYV